jgi:hypothetical protein
VDSEDKVIFEEVVRGEILLYLRRRYPEGAVPRTITNYLDSRGYALDDGALAFQLQYLADSGMLGCEFFPRAAGEAKRIRLVKITTGGIDCVEGRPTGSSGVRF